VRLTSLPKIGARPWRQPRRAKHLLPSGTRLDQRDPRREFGQRTGDARLPLPPPVEPSLCRLFDSLERLDRHTVHTAHAQLHAVFLEMQRGRVEVRIAEQTRSRLGRGELLQQREAPERPDIGRGDLQFELSFHGESEPLRSRAGTKHLRICAVKARE